MVPLEVKSACPVLSQNGLLMYNKHKDQENIYGLYVSEYIRKEDIRMKIDMHCHVKEGSIDSKVGL